MHLGMAMLHMWMKGTGTDTRSILTWSQSLRRQGCLLSARMKAEDAWRYGYKLFRAGVSEIFSRWSDRGILCGL
jgi:hypothetical protein